MTASSSTGPQHELLASNNNSDNAFCIGKGGPNVYCLVIQIEKVNGLSSLGEPPQDHEIPESNSSNNKAVQAWLSYSYFGTVIQTKKFQITCKENGPSTTSTQGFVAIADGFKLRSSVSQLAECFAEEANGMLKIFLCTDGAVLGTAKVDIKRLLSLEGEEDFVERTGKGDFAIVRHGSSRRKVEDAARIESPPYIEVIVSLKREETAVQAIESSTTVSSQTSPKPNKNVRQQPPLLPPPQDPACSAPTPCSSSIITSSSLVDDRIKFEKERRKWEEWRHKEEIKWHQKMREQESAGMKSLEQQSKAQEKERGKAAEASRQEFAKLETRLRKALIEVEKRERRVRTLEASREAEHTTKMAEVQLKERLVKEEITHSVELEKVKLKAANERVAAANKATAAAEERTKQIESSFDEFKKRHRESSEAALIQEIATLKGELAASESRINKIVQEKNEAIFEKEQHRTNVHKVVRALKRERQKVAALEEKDSGQLRLEYANKGQCLAVGGNLDELHRIRQGLASISQSATTLSPQKPHPTAVPTPLTPPRHPASKTSRYIPKSQLSGTPPGGVVTKQWNGSTIDARRKVSSDSKVDRLRRERDSRSMMAGPVVDIDSLLG